MRYRVIDTGASRSFPAPHALHQGASPAGEVVVLLGADAGAALRSVDGTTLAAIAIELGEECLGVHTGERCGEEGSNILGFARFRLGAAPPSHLLELVHQPRTPEIARAAARTVFEGAGLTVVMCGDAPGRIVNRLIRPYYNAALRRLDEGLASASDLDLTLRLGLGYPEGPISLLERTGLAHHYDVSQALYEMLGDPAVVPARRARIAKLRGEP